MEKKLTIILEDILLLFFDYRKALLYSLKMQHETILFGLLVLFFVRVVKHLFCHLQKFDFGTKIAVMGSSKLAILITIL
jgi:hypothetical protein